MSPYAAPYITEILFAMRKRHTRRELRRIFLGGTGRQVPTGVNLRHYVSKWYAHQQAINNHAKPSSFWFVAVGLRTP